MPDDGYGEIIFRLVSDLSVLRLVVTQFIADELKHLDDPEAKLRELSEKVHAWMDNLPTPPNVKIQGGMEHCRDTADKIMLEIREMFSN